MLPAAIAQHTVGDTLIQRLQNHRCGREVHIRNGKRQQVSSAKTVCNIIPLGTPSAVTIDRR